MTAEPTTFPEFLHWGSSTNKENPDMFKIKVTNLDFFDSEHSTNTKAIVDGVEKIIPLGNFSTRNQALLKKWKGYIVSGKIKVGTEFTLTTYKQPYKEYGIRRWDFIF